jgi:(1->4)-alpha-D-glucan 1-alpha-D-glucosylmutase
VDIPGAMSAAPLATYRLQLTPWFGFDAAASVADYLGALGVSHLYASPYLQAAPGSGHGYDVVDPGRPNEELGGEEGHRRLCAALAARGLGQVLDIVPNHMAAVPQNRWWWDVLERGRASAYAGHFDIDWDPPEPRLTGRVLAAILGDQYGRVLEAGELRVDREGERPVIRYHDHSLPLAPESLGDVDLDVLAGDPDALDALLARQHYRVAFWRTALQDLNYRRFFDITTMIALRPERPEVFLDTHRRVLEWVAVGVLDGLRVDHPDGLRDPAGYLRRLAEGAGGRWIVVEKILEPGERLPDDWPVAGTTGYDFLTRVDGLFVDPAGEAPLTDLYVELTGEEPDYAALVAVRKRRALEEQLGADLNRLAAVFTAVCERHRRHRDHTRPELREAVREAMVALPVYRTYVVPEEGRVAPVDEAHVGEAIAAASARRPDLADALGFLGELLLLRVPGAGQAEADLVALFQQLSGPAMAKGVEDSAFYAYNRLLSLNEVGGDPGRFGLSLGAFHAACAEAQERWPTAMLASSTHDTKRSEDVRARISLLSEIPEAWGAAARRWMARNEGLRRDGMPDRNMEYVLYQTLVGAWPLSRERALAYMEKAAREAKSHTSWLDPDPAYEAALAAFVGALLDDEDFAAELRAFVEPLVAPGRVSSLAVTAIRLTAPGVPDVYQGTELWDLSLVDPDNRRPVDFDLRRRLLDELGGLTPEEVLERADEGLPKLLVVQRALALRARRPEAFGPGGRYAPLPAAGERADRVVAFARGGEAVTIAPRLVLGLRGGWGDARVELPDGRWRDVLTGEEAEGGEREVALLLARFPVALLERR